MTAEAPISYTKPNAKVTSVSPNADAASVQVEVTFTARNPQAHIGSVSPQILAAYALLEAPISVRDLQASAYLDSTGLVKIIRETIFLTDVLGYTTTEIRDATESVSFSETVTRTFTKNISDGIAIDDALLINGSIYRTNNNVLSVTEQLTIDVTRLVEDAPVLSEILYISSALAKSDVVSVTDSVIYDIQEVSTAGINSFTLNSFELNS